MNFILFLPLILLSIVFTGLFYFDKERFINYSNTGLGKFVAIILILLYAMVHMGFGIIGYHRLPIERKAEA